jgi:hypothetical protein
MPARLDRRTRGLLDIIAVLWVALWIVLGWVVHHEVLGLRKLSATVVVAGRTVDATASQLDALRDVPFVGQDLHTTAANLRRTARSARFSGRESRASVTSLANWLWFAISGIAILPVLLVYGLLRFGVPLR